MVLKLEHPAQPKKVQKDKMSFWEDWLTRGTIGAFRMLGK